MIEDGRIQFLNQKNIRDDATYVLYWVQQSQRAEFNHALEYAIAEANKLDQSVIVGFGLMDNYPDANERHYAFMLEGLSETAKSLAKRGIKFVTNAGAPDYVALNLAEAASLVVCDRGYLRHQRRWRCHVARRANCRVVQVESDAIVPVDIASNKAEYAARTIRKKLNEKRDVFMNTLSITTPAKSSMPLHVKGELDISNWEEVLESLKVDRKVNRVDRFTPGTSAARSQLRFFLDQHLDGYAEARNDPAKPECSMMSPYLHFGQISPVEIAIACRDSNIQNNTDREMYLEELIVRRELAINFVYFTGNYDSYECLPQWAEKSLAEHSGDDRQYEYTVNQLAAADTHDPAWNAAMVEMLKTGYMHNYMRMYWGKKIIEWSPTPEEAYTNMLALNNRYFLDGRDPNSYAGIAWVFGLHDRAWQEREIFGKIRYMNFNGLKRKFDVDAYVAWANTL